MIEKKYEARCDGDYSCTAKVVDILKSHLVAKLKALGWSMRWTDLGRVTICPKCQGK